MLPFYRKANNVTLAAMWALNAVSGLCLVTCGHHRQVPQGKPHRTTL